MLPPAIMIESHFADARHLTVEETAPISPPKDDPHPHSVDVGRIRDSRKIEVLLSP